MPLYGFTTSDPTVMWVVQAKNESEAKRLILEREPGTAFYSSGQKLTSSAIRLSCKSAKETHAGYESMEFWT